MVSIRTVDPPHEDALHAAYSTFHEGASAGRTAPLVSPYEAFRTSMQEPGPWADRTMFAAYESEIHDRPLGVALLELPTRDNRHLAELEIAVSPRQRGRGIGAALFAEGHTRALAADRSTFICEVFVEVGLALDDSPGGRFALRHGYASVHSEDHLVLELPCDLPDVARPESYGILSWQDGCPEEHLEAYSSMRHAMERDAPSGDRDVEPRDWDSARVRENEARMTKLGYTSLVSVAVAEDGEFGGYTLILLPGHGSTDVYQEDTLVISSHRGHGLGGALKHANMTVLAQQFPERRRIHTWTAGVNGPMQAINAMFGFRVAETMHEVQRVDG